MSAGETTKGCDALMIAVGLTLVLVGLASGYFALPFFRGGGWGVVVFVLLTLISLIGLLLGILIVLFGVGSLVDDIKKDCRKRQEARARNLINSHPDDEGNKRDVTTHGSSDPDRSQVTGQVEQRTPRSQTGGRTGRSRKRSG